MTTKLFSLLPEGVKFNKVHYESDGMTRYESEDHDFMITFWDDPRFDRIEVDGYYLDDFSKEERLQTMRELDTLCEYYEMRSPDNDPVVVKMR